MSRMTLQKYFSVLGSFRLYNSDIIKWAVEQILVKEKIADAEK